MGAAEATVHWSEEHKSKLIVGGLILAVVLAVGFGGWYYLNQQDQKASILLNQAVRTLDTQLRPAGAPAEPDFPSFHFRQGTHHRSPQTVPGDRGPVSAHPHR